MQETTTPTLQDDDVEHRDPTEKFSFIRAAAGFVLDSAPQGGVFTGPPPEPAPAKIESVDVVDLPPLAAPKPPPTPLAHRLMVVALIPFVLIAVMGLIVINRPSPRGQQPAPAPTAVTVPATAPPVAEVAPAPMPTAPAPSVDIPAPTVPVTRAPRAPVAVTTRPPATTPTTEPTPTTTPTTEPPPTTTPTTEPPTTTPTTEPPTTPTTQPETAPPTFVEQP